MKHQRLTRLGSYAAGFAVLAATTVSMAATAAADDWIQVSGTVQCVNQTYTLTVSASKIQTGISSYYFLDGPNLNSATMIGSQQPIQHGQDATASWTPTTSGTHTLWWRGIQPGGGGVIGPQKVNVVDQAPAGQSCTPSTGGGTGSADSLPIIGPLLSQLGL
ncbi:hypothetical protein KO481_12655 [Nocardia sp. NEAU-G5]|uniref:Uncharacterized protein n=1 Tax=Nocardia albiluteola TaxID=2842303 RepID=A0ABS6AXY1_9NOCA|nr:hypothetical protein [Nocardia albiluteola]MBU3062371.1 hypothetical protein [Nocardia albiluteola]